MRTSFFWRGGGLVADCRWAPKKANSCFINICGRFRLKDERDVELDEYSSDLQH